MLKKKLTNAPLPEIQDGDIAIPFTRILYALFFDPSVYVILQHKKVIHSLVLIVGLCFVSGLITSLSVHNSIRDNANQWEKWLASEVQEFGVTNEGALFWKYPTQLPYQFRVADWQIHFTDSPIPKERSTTSPSTKKMVWVSQNNVYLWLLVPAGNFCSPSTDQIVKYDLGKPLIQLLNQEDDLKITTTEIPQFVDRFVLYLRIFFLGTTIVSILFTTLLFPLCSSILSAISLYLSSKNSYRAILSKLFVINLYAVIPPMIIATIYSILDLPDFSYFTVFFIAFFLYQFYIMKMFRHLIHS